MDQLSLGARLGLVFVLPWKLLFDGVLAAQVRQASTAGAWPPAKADPVLPPAPPPASSIMAVEAEPDPDTTAALHLLAILQREGRFVDFLQEDVSVASDADIGAAARVVYAGCKRALADYIEITPLRTEAEGATIKLDPGYDARATRLSGKVAGEPPFTGTLAHHGWRVTSIRLPKLSSDHDARILAPAEVEL